MTMSIIGYREWEIWQNNSWFESPESVQGQFVFAIAPTLMASQTVEFMFELRELVRTKAATVGGLAAAYLSHHQFPRPAQPGGPLYLYKSDHLDTGRPIPPVIETLLDELRALALSVDFPFICDRIEFEVLPGQPRH